MAIEKQYRAVVQKVIRDGPHGDYAVARSDELGSVTFSLDRKVWQEDDRPESGMFVILSLIRKKRAGWRALYGRFVKPDDERETSNSSKATVAKRSTEQ